jgi:hypothetical protein
MKTECNVINDLLPIYIDNCCSIESKQLVDEHLEECEKCKDSYEHMKVSIIDEVEDKSCESEKHDEIIIRKGVKKIRRLWIMSLVAVILLVAPVLMLKNEIKGEGHCFSNINDIHKTNQFLNAIMSENYENAFNYLDIKYAYTNAAQTYPVEINQYRKIANEYFINDMQLLVTNGYKITDSEFVSAYRHETEWCIGFNIYMENENGKNVYIGKLEFITNENGISPIACISNNTDKLNESDRISYLWEAINDWHCETYDDIFGDNQFEPVKEHEAWR